jgi:ABC-2 type transport system permease protein
MKNLIRTVVKKELSCYFISPLAFIFLVIFLIFQMGFTFILGRFYDSNNAGLEIFFTFHPWLYLFLVPAVGMRLWAEEKSEGTLETLFTLPISLPVIIVGKFLASWLFILIALALTFPVVITVYYLGRPDFGPIFSGYLGSWMMAGAFLSITCFTSSLTKNQVISFVLSVIICFVFVLLGFGIFQQYLTFLPVALRDFLANLGFIPHFQQAMRGIIDTRDLLYFASIIVFFLVLNTAALEKKKIS